MAWDGGSGLFSDDFASGTFCAEAIDQFEASKPPVELRNAEIKI